MVGTAHLSRFEYRTAQVEVDSEGDRAILGNDEVVDHLQAGFIAAGNGEVVLASAVGEIRSGLVHLEPNPVVSTASDTRFIEQQRCVGALQLQQVDVTWSVEIDGDGVATVGFELDAGNTDHNC